MPPRRGCHLPVADKTFLDDPELVLIRPLPTANAIGCGENFDLRAVNEIGHKVGLIIGSQPKSDGPRRSLTVRFADLIDFAERESTARGLIALALDAVIETLHL